MRAKSAPEGCPSRVVDAASPSANRPQPPPPGRFVHSRRCGRPSPVCAGRQGVGHGSPDRSPARAPALAAALPPPDRPGGRLAAAARARGGPRLRPARLALRRRATAASTCSGTVGQPVRAALPGTVTFAGMLAGRGVVVVDHGATRTTYEPVAATVAVGTPVAAGAPGRHPRARRVALLPARLPALGLDRGRDLPRPAPPGRRRAGPAAAALARRSRVGSTDAQARGWAWRYAARSRSVVTWV